MNHHVMLHLVPHLVDSCAYYVPCLFSIPHRAPIATGVALMSSDDMRDSGMKGKGVKICHILGDELW